MIVHQNDNSRGNYNYNLCNYRNITYMPHFHRNLELIYVRSGELTASICGREAALGCGQYALILPNQVHAFKTERDSSCWIAVFSEEFVPHFAAMVKGKQGEAAGFFLSDQTHRFVQQQIAQGDASIMMKKACLYAVCDEYLSQVRLTERRPNDVKVGNILDFIAENFREDISLEMLAKRFGYEYHYLSRLLNKYYRINLREIVNEYRIEAAKEMLLSDSRKITAIALECGFQSIRSFNYAFKQITGATPTAYVRAVRSEPGPS